MRRTHASAAAAAAAALTGLEDERGAAAARAAGGPAIRPPASRPRWLSHPPSSPAPASAPARTVDDAAAFEQWCGEVFPRVAAYARAHAANRDVAADVVARVFLKACQARTRAAVPLGDAGLAWLLRATYTTAIDHWRADARRAETAVDDDDLRGIHDGRALPDGAWLAYERATHVRRAVAQLPPLDRRILILKYAGDLTVREISHRLQLSPSAVTMRLWRALRLLRTRLPHLAPARHA